MNWFLLIIAGLFEVGFAIGTGMQHANPHGTDVLPCRCP